MTAGESPGTSEIASVTSFAGAQAAASLPPLIAESCLRMRFIVPIGAPEASSALLTSFLSSSVRPGAGKVSSAEAPPEISAITWSSGRKFCTAAMIFRAASSLAASGTGCAASSTVIFCVGVLWP